MSDANDLLFGSSSPSVAFDPGATIRGRITEFTKNHRRAYDAVTQQQGGKMYWGDDNKPYEADLFGPKSPDHRPVETPVLHLDTALRGYELVARPREGQDDGARRLFLTDRAGSPCDSLLGAVKAAIVAAGVRKVSVGDYVEVSCTGEAKSARAPRGSQKAKLFTAVYHLASAPPQWAADIGGSDAAADGEGDPFA